MITPEKIDKITQLVSELTGEISNAKEREDYMLLGLLTLPLFSAHRSMVERMKTEVEKTLGGNFPTPIGGIS